MSSPKKPLTIILADPRWVGHHPTYFIEFTSSFLRLGHRVIGLCREPEQFRKSAEEVCEEMGLRFEERVVVGKLPDPDRAFLRPGQDHDPVSAYLRWQCLKSAVAKAEAETSWTGDFVFLPFLDTYLRFQPTLSLPGSLKKPWSGLYFRNHHFSRKQGLVTKLGKGDRSLRSTSCHSFGVLDERFVDEMRSFTEKEVIIFPDITNEEQPVVPSPLVEEILQKAAGRKIIGMVSLEKRKGFLTMLKIAEAVDGIEDWYFVAAGKYAEDTCDEEEQAYVQKIQDRVDRGELSNLYLKIPGERVNDGNDFNGLIKTLDVVYAAYEDFEGSSNALTKGAIFERPIVATKGECVGGRVEKFRLGQTMAQGDVQAGIVAIRKILAGEGMDGAALNPQFSEYHALHNRERLDEVFHELLNNAGLV